MEALGLHTTCQAGSRPSHFDLPRERLQLIILLSSYPRDVLSIHLNACSSSIPHIAIPFVVRRGLVRYGRVSRVSLRIG